MRRMGRVTLFALVALIAAVVLQPAGAVATGEQRVLVVLATSGAEPYTVAEVERTMHEADGFLRTASLGKVRLHVDVTPWLAAFTEDPGCGATNRGLKAVVQPARFGADRAGYDTSNYDNVIYAIADSHCGFQGASFGHEVMLSRQPTVALVVHELGHAFGLGHAQASNCAAAWLSCAIYDTGDPALSPHATNDQDDVGAGAPGRHRTGDLVDRVSLATLPRAPLPPGLSHANRIALRSIERLDAEPDQGRPTVDRAWRVVPDSRVVPSFARARGSRTGGGLIPLGLRILMASQVIANAYRSGTPAGLRCFEATKQS